MEAFFRGEITASSATARRRYQSELTINSSLKPYTSIAVPSYVHHTDIYTPVRIGNRFVLVVMRALTVIPAIFATLILQPLSSPSKPVL